MNLWEKYHESTGLDFNTLMGGPLKRLLIKYRKYNLPFRKTVDRLLGIPFITADVQQIKKVLDVGCGSGYTLSMMKYFYPDIKCYGIDIVKVDGLQNFISFSKVDIEKEHLPYEDGYFDLIICQGVIEHLRNPSHLIKECYRVLRKDGICHILTENYTSVFLPTLKISKHTINFYDDPTHIRPYTKKSLYACMKMVGFEKVHIFTPRNIFIILSFPILCALQLTKRSDIGRLIFEIFAPALFCEVRK